MNWIDSTWFPLLAGLVLKTSAALGVSCLLALTLRNASASIRHLVWTAAFVTVLLLPLVSLSVPALPFPLSRSIAAPAVLLRAEAQAIATPSTVIAPASRPIPKTKVPSQIPWRPMLLIVWAFGTTLALARMLFALRSLRHWKRTAQPAEYPDLAPLAASLGVHRPIRILESKLDAMPMVAGIFHPVLLLPADISQWDPERRRMVLLHELAHVRRADIATQWIARLALTLHWWNPLAIFAWRQFVTERERAADDLVLSVGARPSNYAGHLLAIARSLQSVPSRHWQTAVAMVRPSQLESRLKAILDAKTPRNVPSHTATWITTVALTLCVLIPLAAIQAQDALQASAQKAPAVPADVTATIQLATSQKNYKMLDDGAKAAEARRLYDIARQLREASLTVRGNVSGTSSPEYAIGLQDLAHLALQQRQRKQAAELYTQSLPLLNGRPEAAGSMVPLGILAMAAIRLEEAAAFFQQAEKADPGTATTALGWQAILQARQGNLAEAEALHRRAIEAAAPDSLAAASTLELFAGFLKQRAGREADSKSAKDQAAGIRKRQAEKLAASTRAVRPPAVRSGDGITPPKLLTKVEPEYTEEARIAKLQGTAVLHVEIGPDGVPANMEVASGVGLGLDQKAIDAVRRWTFQPATRNGSPVPVSATIEVNWRLL